MKKTKQENEPLDLELVPYVTYVPVNTIALEIHATIFENSEMQETVKSEDMAMIRQGMKDGQDWEDEFGRYELTEKMKGDDNDDDTQRSNRGAKGTELRD